MTMPLYGEPLTSREREVLALAGAGASNKEIGAILFIGENTVKTHLLRASIKLGTHDRYAAAAAADVAVS
ncbi:helix-turn-helix domain-containing protein [Kutzneria albida]|uniref:HTH luxR-type domain-containing protein n=1 Tax=Kutzneria albida DSM 43870 TaxID=1449976 RepID=W5WBI8_9PSEU|nr:helix-turn-helix transcriptional regulator [Kutzneria albida]AHH98222.1 hypothetical protein KALB_4860 [Kutzneria albida DSM 43870]